MTAPTDTAWRRLIRPTGFSPEDTGLPGRELARNRRGWIRHFRNPDGRGFYLKAVTPRGVWDRLRFTLVGHPLAREARNLARMEAWGIPAARAVGVAVHRSPWGIFRRAYLLVEEVENTRSLDDWLEDSLDRLSPTAQRRALESFGRILARLHGHGYVDRDMHFRNILVREAAEELEFFLIDSPKGGRPWSPWARKTGRVHDLACLDKHAGRRLSRSQRLRVLRAYLGRALAPSDRGLLEAVRKRARTLMIRREKKLRRDALRADEAYQRSRE